MSDDEQQQQVSGDEQGSVSARARYTDRDERRQTAANGRGDAKAIAIGAARSTAQSLHTAITTRSHEWRPCEEHTLLHCRPLPFLQCGATGRERMASDCGRRAALQSLCSRPLSGRMGAWAQCRGANVDESESDAPRCWNDDRDAVTLLTCFALSLCC